MLEKWYRVQCELYFPANPFKFLIHPLGGATTSQVTNSQIVFLNMNFVLANVSLDLKIKYFYRL